MPEYIDFVAPIPTEEDFAIESLLFELGIKIDVPEKVWE